MLVLGRELDQEIRIDGPCTIRVVQIRDGRVRLGVIADLSVTVLRGELPDRKRDEETDAA